MKVSLDGSNLFMQPETDADQQVLQKLIAMDVVGFGRDPVTMEVIHAELPISLVQIL